MLKAYNFLTVIHDNEEIERKKISKLIRKKMIEQGYGPK